MKKCSNSSCTVGVLQSLDCFPANKNRPDGLHHQCKTCAKAYRETHKESIRALQKAWYNKTDSLKRHNEWKTKNLEQMKRLRLESYHRNKDTQALWRKENKGKMRSYHAKRRALLISATPKWADLKEIELIYKGCPEGYHVDHIIPLNNELVCGLHVPWNLQYLPAVENLKKSNRL